jgi:hypothetical protein
VCARVRAIRISIIKQTFIIEIIFFKHHYRQSSFQEHTAILNSPMFTSRNDYDPYKIYILKVMVCSKLFGLLHFTPKAILITTAVQQCLSFYMSWFALSFTLRVLYVFTCYCWYKFLSSLFHTSKTKILNEHHITASPYNIQLENTKNLCLT